jgi:hypothetical protein
MNKAPSLMIYGSEWNGNQNSIALCSTMSEIPAGGCGKILIVYIPRIRAVIGAISGDNDEGRDSCRSRE